MGKDSALDQMTISLEEFQNSGQLPVIRQQLALAQADLLNVIRQNWSPQAVNRIEESSKRLKITPLELLAGYDRKTK